MWVHTLTAGKWASDNRLSLPCWGSTPVPNAQSKSARKQQSFLRITEWQTEIMCFKYTVLISVFFLHKARVQGVLSEGKRFNIIWNYYTLFIHIYMFILYTVNNWSLCKASIIFPHPIFQLRCWGNDTCWALESGDAFCIIHHVPCCCHGLAQILHEKPFLSEKGKCEKAWSQENLYH